MGNPLLFAPDSEHDPTDTSVAPGGRFLFSFFLVLFLLFFCFFWIIIIFLFSGDNEACNK